MATEVLHRSLGLTDEEYRRIEEILGRPPNHTELAMYSVMWSEHCSYKSSKVHLASLPSEGPHVLMGPGEGAGVVRVDDVAVALRIESHNHPSFVEPFQGAATGIGGIVRDVLSVGARPIALLDTLRFGPLPAEKGRTSQGAADRNRYLVEGVVGGISSYGNCIGVPTVGGEIRFEATYSGNPLVNVMCIGVMPADRLMRATAEQPGNRVILLGSSTGRDGIGGVSVLASAAFDEEAEAKRPSVQVGDPFTEKLLVEATLELIERGLVAGVQDLGGAGLACATSETAARGGTGMSVDISNVPRREEGMEPFEVLTSESQERMLAVVRPEDVDEVLAVCDKWGLPAAVIGEVTEGDRLTISDGGEEVAEIPAASLGEGPSYDRPRHRPGYLDVLAAEEISTAPPADLASTLITLLSSPNLASKAWAWEQYDHQVMLGTVVGPGHDAAVLRIPGTSSRLAVTTDGNGRYCYLDPYEGTRHTVAEAARNLSAVGAEPIALTNCLNFGDPEREEVMWQFAEATRALGEAALALGTPVTGGNVSFYNETGDLSIYPTPIVGMIGVIPQEVTPPPLGFRRSGDVIAVLGDTRGELGGSEYARTILGKVAGRLPRLDLDSEMAAGRAIRELIASGSLSSVHDISEGGLAVALAESCVAGRLGAAVKPGGSAGDLAPHVWLFSESASRYLVSYPEEMTEAVLQVSGRHDVTVHEIGRVGGEALTVSQAAEVSLQMLVRSQRTSFPKAMGYSPGPGLGYPRNGGP
jgi:phosphoribosylformylglycinamidine synthase II